MLLTAAFAGLISLSPALAGCPPEMNYTEKSASVARYDGLNNVYFDVVVRRYSQVTSSCAYKQWIQTAGAHATEVEFTVYIPSYAISSIAIVRDRGSITWSIVQFTKHDTESYQVYSGCAPGGLAFCSLSHLSMGSPPPGNLDHSYKTNNLPSAYYGHSIRVQVNAVLWPNAWPQPVELLLESPP